MVRKDWSFAENFPERFALSRMTALKSVQMLMSSYCDRVI